MSSSLYQLPKNFPAQPLDRPGGKGGAIHLKPGALIELSDDDYKLLCAKLPAIARGVRKNEAKKLSAGKLRVREAKLEKAKATKKQKEAKPAEHRVTSFKHVSKSDEVKSDEQP